MVNLTIEDRIVLCQVARMVAQIDAGHGRAAHIRADIQALVSECAIGADGCLRGDLLTVVFHRWPGVVEYRPVADVLGVLPSSLRLAAGK